jgi:ATP-binding cassette subfamily B protein
MTFFMILTVVTKCVMPLWMSQIATAITEGGPSAHARVWTVLWYVFWTLALHNFTWLAYDWCIVYFEVDCMRDVDQRSFARVQRQSARFFENAFAGSLVTSAKRIRHTLEFVTDAYVYSLGRSAVMIVITTVVFWMRDAWYGIAFAAWAVGYCVISYYLARLRLHWDAISAKADSAVGGALADSFGNNQAIRSFAQEEAEQERFDAISEDCRRKRLRAWLFGGIIARIQGLFIGAMEFGIIAALVYGWTRGIVTIGDFVFFQTYAILMVYQTFDIGNVLNKVFKHVADAEEMAEIYDTEPEVQDAAGARPLIVDIGDVVFHAVDFSYGSGLRRAVRDFSLHVRPGESVAIVGKSGAGKSTLVKLLQRFYDVNSGYIAIDGQYVTNVTQVSLRQFLSLVPQQPELFHRSIRDNIAFARPDASEEEIMDAVERARALDFIRRLPDGIETLVGERGVKLSGGERQRIAIARAFLADRPILVLDEATSALDSVTERLIQAAIRDLMKGRTSIAIAHRLSTIMNADRILVMDDGAIAESGTHTQLLGSKGLYADLWSHQVDGYLR